MIDPGGRLICRFLHQNLQAGKYEIPVNFSELRQITMPGEYFITLTSSDGFYSAKMLLVQ
jgi:hypothetical protein